jgi:hypothetical protein
MTDDPLAVADAAYRKEFDPGDVSGTTGEDSEIAEVRREAAGYRRKLRDTEAERDNGAARAGDVQRPEETCVAE